MMTLINAVLAGSFPAILLALTIVTGIMWLLDRYRFAPKRKAAALAAEQQFDANQYALNGADAGEARSKLRESQLKMPWWLDYTAGFFTVILAVFVLRSFVAEPFRIPSASMMPTLQSGDLILVNKFTWGLRMPVYNTKLLATGLPDRGDVIVFRFPPNESQDYIKRVVALPGDTLEYNNKVLSINGKALTTAAMPEVLDETGEASGDKMSYVKQIMESHPRVDGQTKSHGVFNTPNRSSAINSGSLGNHVQSCSYLAAGIKCTVPAGHYFAMGDNRDNSLDSRYWGFVPERNIVGKAFFIWMNLDGKFNRLGSFQ
jgi:signal peptidase I